MKITSEKTWLASSKQNYPAIKGSDSKCRILDWQLFINKNKKKTSNCFCVSWNVHSHANNWCHADVSRQDYDYKMNDRFCMVCILMPVYLSLSKIFKVSTWHPVINLDTDRFRTSKLQEYNNHLQLENIQLLSHQTLTQGLY